MPGMGTLGAVANTLCCSPPTKVARVRTPVRREPGGAAIVGVVIEKQNREALMPSQQDGSNMANSPASRGSAAGGGADEISSPIDGGTGQLGGGAMGPLGANTPGTAGGGLGGLAGAAAAGDPGVSLSQAVAAQTPAVGARENAVGGGTGDLGADLGANQGGVAGGGTGDLGGGPGAIGDLGGDMGFDQAGAGGDVGRGT